MLNRYTNLFSKRLKHIGSITQHFLNRFIILVTNLTLRPNYFVLWLMQRIFAAIFVLILSPILLITLLLIWVIEREKPVFIQERIGLHKEPFNVYKLRTMQGGKITFLGRILRKTGIDELPQLFNILAGDMHFVGPRPLTQHDISRLQWDDAEHATRWSVKPGITGVAQLVNVCDARVSWECDQHYLKHRSMLLDLKLIGQSLLVPIVGKSAVKQVIHKSAIS